MKRIQALLLASALVVVAILTACSAPAKPAAGATATSQSAVAVLDTTPIAKAPTPTLFVFPSITPRPTSVPKQMTAFVPTLDAAAAGTATVEARLALPATPPPTSAPAPAGQAPAAIKGPAVTASVPTANLRSGPSAAYAIVGSLGQGQAIAVTGRLADNSWWQVENSGQPAWIAASVVQASADAASVAVVTQLPPTPVPAAAPPPASGGQVASGGAGHIAFARGNGSTSDIALLDVASGKISIVVPNGRQPSMRNDGHLLYKATGGGRNTLFTVWPDGSQLTQVSQWGEDVSPQWAPTKLGMIFSTSSGDRDRVALQWDTTHPEGDPIMRVEYIPNANGTPKPVYGRFPAWLTDSRIAFAGCDSWLQGSNCGIWTIDTDQWRNFRPFPLTTNIEDRPSSAFGETLLFSSSASGNWEIYAIRWTLPARKVDPKPEPRNLTNNGGQDVAGAFSPDGSQIAFISNRGGWGIWVMNADGSGQRQLAAVPEGFGPRWDEERISWGP